MSNIVVGKRQSSLTIFIWRTCVTIPKQRAREDVDEIRARTGWTVGRTTGGVI